MRSISGSRSSLRGEFPGIRARGLHLSFHSPMYRRATLRDEFTSRFGAGPRAPAEEGRVVVARGLDLDIRRGERVGLVGMNGTGKTSLLRCIAGIYRPTAGSLEVAGRVRAVFDTSVGILPELTGRENAHLLARFIYPDVTDTAEIAEEAVEFAALGRFADMPYRIYSNGMQARLCLSLVSARPADILILDEVFDGADEFFRERMAARVLNVIERSGIVLFVSHDAALVQRVCNRAIVLRDGRLAFDGTPLAAFEAYRSLARI
jgi:ABC-type polysaccharide/polyol phosphate transport system ATPase subunit